MLWDVDVWREMERLRGDMDQLYSNWGRSTGAMRYPLMNVYDGKDDVTVTAELPGVSKEEVSITFSDGVLTISGKRDGLAKAGSMTPVRQERAVGPFEKTLRIPTKVRQDQINASFANGVLTVTLPKAEEAKPRTITIEAR